MIDTDDIWEFLRIYGWVILIVVVGIGLFAYFGVVNVNSGVGTEETYQLENGDIVFCKESILRYCGLTLKDCVDGFEYNCLTNVKKISDV